MEIDEGHFGEVPLDGLKFAAWYRWPGPVHEGGGIVQGIVDRRADASQREAIFKILGGEEQEPTTVFNIYGSTIAKEYDPLIADIEFEWDLEGRSGRLHVPEVLDCRLQAIRNPVTGKEHRAQIVLPEGFEFKTGEMASADFLVTSELVFAGRNRYGVLWQAAYGPYGRIGG